MKLLSLVLILLFSLKVSADSPTIAVATNFNHAMNSIVNSFEDKYKIKIQVSYGSTGSLYAQILNGAPFDAFFSADTKTIDLILDNELGLENSPFIYAMGTLAFICNSCPKEKLWSDTLRTTSGKIAIANPKLAPYGQAAKEALGKLKKTSKIDERLVYGSNVGQAFQFVESGNIPFGLVAHSLAVAGKINKERYQIISKKLYTPIEQSAVILKRTKNLNSMKTFFNYLKSDEVSSIIKKFGYKMKESSSVK
ncbi:molybdate ABC transporter substrate-binding protein [Halobacteriovorax sp.]|uniref:molybdate ABC transporter substrate-binding protein n=1 Tax=Halobacteriovorax sp. TaxID=2020862 RepID=UPI0035661B4C